MKQKTYEEIRKDTYEKVEIHELINFDKEPDYPIKVSIVIPVCNVEQYLRECIESAINQTLQEIEIICVNDGSNDGSLEILKEYAEKDERVKIIDKDNAGYGHTMNIGMDMAKGEYIGIIESDDYVKCKMFETLYNIAILEAIDIVKADFYRFTKENGYVHLFYNVLTDNQFLYNKTIYEIDTIDMFKFTNTWSGIYKKSFLEKFMIRHQETPGASYQDNGFWFQTTVSASKIYYLNQPFYMNRRDNVNSSVYQKNKVKMANNEYDFIFKFLDRNTELKEKYLRYYYVKKFDNYYYCYRQIEINERKEYIQKFSKEFKNALIEGMIDENLFSPSRYKMLCKIVEKPLEFYEETKDLEDVSYNSQIVDEKTIPIVFICDEGYSIPTATAISSLLKFKKNNTKYDITIIAVNMSDANIKKISLIKCQNVSINIIYIEENEFTNLHSSEITNYGVPTTALVKFLIPEIMQKYDKVLYLDGDIIVKRDLSSLFNEDLEDCYAGVVRDIPQVLYKKPIFGIKYKTDYFNSGVMLLNIKKLKSENITALLIETKKNLKSKLMDQDVFNEVFFGKVKQLSIEYNTLYVNLIRSKGKYDIGIINKNYEKKYKKLEDIRRASSIIHYCSKDKPWKFYDVPMADAWLEHYFRSAYGDFKLLRNSSLNMYDEKNINGKIELYEKQKEPNMVFPIVFHYTTLNSKEILSNIKFLNSCLSEKEQCQIYLISNGKNSIPKDLFEADISSQIKINYIDIHKMIERDKEYSGNNKLHDNYYRMLVPEILCQYEKILIIDGAIINKDIRKYFLKFDSDKIVNFINKETYSFWNSPVVIINVVSFIINITKFKFFDFYNDRKTGNFTYSKSFYSVIPKLQTGCIDEIFFNIEEKRNYDDIIISLNSQLIAKDKSFNYVLSEYKNLQAELIQQRNVIDQLNKELILTKTSLSCRLGLFLTAIPRRVREFFKKIK